MTKVLIVDDETSIRFSFAKILADAGYDAVSAAGPSEAADRVSEGRIDIAIVDRLLANGQNGFDVARRIKETHPFCEIILISAYPTFQSASEAMKFNPFAYLTKPVKTETLCRTVMEAALKGRAREESKRIEQIYTLILNSSADAIVIAGLDGRPLYVNPEFTRLFGWALHEITDINTQFEPESEKGQIDTVLDELIRGGTAFQNLESVYLAKDGRKIRVAVSGSRYDDHAGNPEGVLLILRDISDKALLEERVRRAERMESIGMLAAGIAHDFNNILFPMMGYAEMALEEIPENVEVRHFIEEIVQASSRAKGLIEQILTFSRQNENERKPLRIQYIVKEVIQFLRSTLPSSINIKTNIDSKAGYVAAVPAQIHQVIMNLCGNAADAMEENDEGRLEVTLKEVVIEPADPNRFADMTPGRYIRLEISDTGHGIPDSEINKIFDPYFTTKMSGKGTGLGLSVTHGIVKNHGGHIFVQSRPGKGAAFTIYLPVVEKENEPEQNALKIHDSIPQGKGRLLVVDDEEHVLKVERRIMEKLGYRVSTFNSGGEALQAFLTSPYAFDAVILDITMPKMSGVTLAREILSRRPGLPVILLTGNNETAPVEKIDQLDIRGVYIKPVEKRKMAEILYDALNVTRSAFAKDRERENSGRLSFKALPSGELYLTGE